MKRGQVIAKRRRRTTKAPLQPSDLVNASIDSMRRQAYLSVSEAREYLGFRTEWRIYKLLKREPRIRRRRFGTELRIWRADLDPPAVGLQAQRDGRQQVSHTGGR